MEEPQNNVSKEISRGDRDQIIEALVKMRIEKFATTRSMLRLLKQKPLYYKDSYAYELIREAKKKIIEIFKEEMSEEFETYRARLETLIETTSNEKIKLDAMKELHKLTGAYKPNKVEVSGKIEHTITSIEVNIIDSNTIDITPEKKKLSE